MSFAYAVLVFMLHRKLLMYPPVIVDNSSLIVSKQEIERAAVSTEY